MPLSKIQSAILLLQAAHRDPTLNREAVRYSGDIDIFHDREERVATAAEQDAVEKSPGLNPEGLIAEIRRNSHYPAAEWRALVTSEVLEPNEIVGRLDSLSLKLRRSFTRMPRITGLAVS